VHYPHSVKCFCRTESALQSCSKTVHRMLSSFHAAVMYFQRPVLNLQSGEEPLYCDHLLLPGGKMYFSGFRFALPGGEMYFSSPRSALPGGEMYFSSPRSALPGGERYFSGLRLALPDGERYLLWLILELP
jgi:hypothetical protein